MKKTKRLWLGFSLTSVLMAGTSLGGSYYVMENFEPALYREQRIVVGGDTLSQAEFAENIEKKEGVWFFRNAETGELTDLNVLSDFRTKGDRRYRLYQKLRLKKHVDTIMVKKDRMQNRLYYFYGPNDSIPNMPSMGSVDWDRLNIRHFVSDDPKVQARLDVYNNARNCTERHENQHFIGAQNGLTKSGRSYETVFGDMCMDEVAANLAQFMEQRKNYLEHGRDETYITPRFEFYKKWLHGDSLAAGDSIPPLYGFCGTWLKPSSPFAGEITAEEAAFIANGIFDSWKKDKFPIYINRNVNRTVHLLKEADYNGCQDHPDEHRELMRRIFNIDGIDFYQYIAGRENEFVRELPPEHKERFANLLKIKKNKMDYFEKVGQLTQNDPQKKERHFAAVKLKHRWNKFVGRLTGR